MLRMKQFKGAAITISKPYVHLSADFSAEPLVLRRTEWSGEVWPGELDMLSDAAVCREENATPCLRIS